METAELFVAVTGKLILCWWPALLAGAGLAIRQAWREHEEERKRKPRA